MFKYRRFFETQTVQVANVAMAATQLVLSQFETLEHSELIME